MTESNGWVFGKKGDLIVFTGPLLISLVLLSMHKGAIWGFQHTDSHFAFIQIYINLAHLYSTFWYTYTSDFEWKRFRHWFVAVPLLVFAVNLSLGYLTDRTIVFLIFTHYSLWHFVKQQQAWFFIAVGRGAKPDVWTQRINSAAIQACTMGFVIASQSMSDSRGWVLPRDIVELPDFVRTPALIVSFTLVALYFVWHGRKIWRGDATNWAAHHIFLCTLLLWGYTRLGERSVLTYYLNQLHHAIPYLWLGYRHIRVERAAGRLTWLGHAPMWLVGVGIFVIAGFQGQFEMNMRAGEGILAGVADFMDPYGGGLICLSFFNALNITHYTLDKFYWNRQHNPEWTQALGDA